MKVIKIILVSLMTIFAASMYIVSFAPMYMQADLYLLVFVFNVILIFASVLACEVKINVEYKPWQSKMFVK